jgi:hypothetical protein
MLLKNPVSKSKDFGVLHFTKILVQFSREDNSHKISSSAIAYFADENGYLTGPIGCSNCKQYIMGIRNSIKTE